MCLFLPWEVIERVIDHACNDVNLLCNLSLTCRQLRPRSFSLIVAYHIFLDNRDRVSNFCDFLVENPELQPRIRSITISPTDVRPIPLMNMLPHLSTLRFITPKHKEYHRQEDRPMIQLHSAMLNCYCSFGKRIDTLFLEHLSFRTACDFFRLVLAFPKTTRLTCNDIAMISLAKDTSAMDVVRGKLSKHLSLELLHVSTYTYKTVYIRVNSMSHITQINTKVENKVAYLLLDSSSSTAQTLRWTFKKSKCIHDATNS